MTGKEQIALYLVVVGAVGTTVCAAVEGPPLLAASFLVMAMACFGYVTRETIREGLSLLRPEREGEQ